MLASTPATAGLRMLAAVDFPNLSRSFHRGWENKLEPARAGLRKIGLVGVTT